MKGENMAFLPGKCRLHILLNEKKISQQELADLIGMTRQQISNYANDFTKMSLGNAKTIADALHIHIDDLYNWDSYERQKDKK
jgi:transcriptional regulator with XRE-family HTH domain